MNTGGVKIQGILTPGHTPGAMCYLVNDSLLFTGDALRLNKGKVEKFYSFFNMDSETAAHSIGKIIHIPGVRYLFTAHNGYTDNFKYAINDWQPRVVSLNAGRRRFSCLQFPAGDPWDASEQNG